MACFTRLMPRYETFFRRALELYEVAWRRATQDPGVAVPAVVRRLQAALLEDSARFAHAFEYVTASEFLYEWDLPPRDGSLKRAERRAFPAPGRGAPAGAHHGRPGAGLWPGPNLVLLEQWVAAGGTVIGIEDDPERAASARARMGAQGPGRSLDEGRGRGLPGGIPSALTAPRGW